jgi:23S rRNA (adenine2503-C2)-methyltransferase
MKVVMEKGLDELATVYVSVHRNDDRYMLEFVDSLSGSESIEDKWVIVASSQFGCPVGCLMCDTKDYFEGNPTSDELLSQVDHLVRKRFPNGSIPVKKFKVQFARMGEPALNINVINAIEEIHHRYEAPGFMPCISTTAPSGTEEFFNELKRLNHDIFKGNFQLQFSIHSTDEGQRDMIMPVSRWSLERIAEYGKQFFVGGRKVSLNFALAPENELDPGKIGEIFPPDIFMIKLTPVNPTEHAMSNRMVREGLTEDEVPQIGELRKLGFDVVLSVGDPRENHIGSNCGQLAALWKRDPRGPN